MLQALYSTLLYELVLKAEIKLSWTFKIGILTFEIPQWHQIVKFKRVAGVKERTYLVRAPPERKRGKSLSKR